MDDRGTNAGLAGGGDFELDQPSGIAVDAAGIVSVANTDKSQIKMFAPS